EIIRGLRLGEFDVLVGINLLREGLDLPEVSLVAILDADQEGFLRSDRSLIQTVGRAARNLSGKAILYADRVTGSMQRALDEMQRRRGRQQAYNDAHDITPRSIVKSVDQVRFTTRVADAKTAKAMGPVLGRPADARGRLRRVPRTRWCITTKLEPLPSTTSTATASSRPTRPGTSDSRT